MAAWALHDSTTLPARGQELWQSPCKHGDAPTEPYVAVLLDEMIAMALALFKRADVEAASQVPTTATAH
jgi:hypothetical protein